MPSPRQVPQVFVSHASADNAWCAEFVMHLQTGGANVWWDVSGMRIGLLAIQIEREVQTRAVFVPILSPHIYERDGDYRPWLKLEYSMAITLQTRQEDVRAIVPVVAASCQVPPLFDIFLGARGATSESPAQAANEVLRLLGLEHKTGRYSGQLQVPRAFEEGETLGRNLLSQGRAEDALNVFRTLQHRAKGWKSTAKEGAAWFGIGRSEYDLEHHDEALAAYNCAIELAPDDARGWAGRGSLYGELGRPTDALPDFERATQLKEDYQGAWLNKSNVLRALGRLDESLEAANTGVNLAPLFGPGYFIRANALKALQQPDKALAALEKALALPETSPTSSITSITSASDWTVHALTMKAELLLKGGYPETALTLYEEIVVRDEAYGPGWHGVGNANYQLGRYNEAMRAYEQALKLQEVDGHLPGLVGNKAENLSVAWEGKAFALMKLGRYGEAHISFEHALANKPIRSNTLRGLGELFMAEGEYQKAHDAFKAATVQEGESVDRSME